jgi:DNA primase
MQIPFDPKSTPKTTTGFAYGINIKNTDYLEYKTEAYTFALLGGVNIKQLDRLRVTLKITRNPQLSPLHSYRSSVDLYNDRQTEAFVRRAAEQLETGSTQLREPLQTLIDSLERYRLDKRAELHQHRKAPEITLSPKERKAALSLLQQPTLLDLIGDYLADLGLIGETDNGLLIFLIFLTRNFDHPLHAIVHGSSGSGKSNLLKTVIGTVPEESKHLTTALTENVLFYPPYKDFWKRKILMLEDLDGSYSALLPLREFMSNQYISKFVTEMDSNTGEHKQRKLEANGPICIVGATTKEKVYEDNSNRSFLLHVNESKSHQKAIMAYQSKEAAGLIDHAHKQVVFNLMQNVQRLLEPIRIVNPYQPDLELPDMIFKPLRTNKHYITLIKAVTFLHQHQLERKTDAEGRPYIETTFEHIEWANRLCKESLLRKSDELNGQQRQFFERLKWFCKGREQETFFTHEVRQAFRIHPMSLTRNLATLERFDYVTCISRSRKPSSEFKVNVWDDYDILKKGVDLLDEKLHKLKGKALKKAS